VITYIVTWYNANTNTYPAIKGKAQSDRIGQSRRRALRQKDAGTKPCTKANKRGGSEMRLWYSIRRPIGYLLLALVSYGVLIVIHGLPFLFADLILGRG